MKHFLRSVNRPYILGVSVVFVALVFSTVFVFADTETPATTVTVGNAAPTIDSVSLDTETIVLSEGSFKLASTTIAITDTNGVGTVSGGQCSGLVSVTAKLYRSAVSTEGTNCAVDDNNCYATYGSCVATTTGDQCTGGSDTQVEYDCGFKIWYIADPTDSGGFATDIWVVSATTTDGTDTASATNTGQLVEVNELFALDVLPATIAYGSVAANSNTGATNQTATSTNTGNTAIDNQISGDVMCTDYSDCDGDTFKHDQQKFDTSDVTYASLTNTLAATASPATIELDLAKPTATTTAVEDLTYWGIAIPDGQPAGSYTGQNSFTATAD